MWQKATEDTRGEIANVKRKGSKEAKCITLFASYASPSPLTGTVMRTALDLLSPLSIEREQNVTRTHWLLVGAIGLGLAIGLYLLFFCPTDCH